MAEKWKNIDFEDAIRYVTDLASAICCLSGDLWEFSCETTSCGRIVRCRYEGIYTRDEFVDAWGRCRECALAICNILSKESHEKWNLDGGVWITFRNGISVQNESPLTLPMVSVKDVYYKIRKEKRHGREK